MQTFALAVIGRDRPGIVAAVTGALLQHGVNVEDSQATILRGHFTMMLVLAVPDDGDEAALRTDLEAAASEVGLEALSLQPVDELEGEPVEPSHIVTLHGVDHPGIVHAATDALARSRANITDMNTRLVSDSDGDEEALYALMIEVALSGDARELEEALTAVGDAENLEVNLRELEQDEL